VIEIIPTTMEHYRTMAGTPPTSSRSLTLLEDGVPLGIGGSYHAGKHVVCFMHLSDEIKDRPRLLIKLGRAMRDRLPYKTVYSVCDENIEAAERFLIHFGFEPIGGGICKHSR
jgi:hypothetical protein